jgi:hypothetical protein
MHFIVFGLTRLVLEPTIYRTGGAHAIHYAMNAVFDFIFALTFYRSILFEMDLPHTHANIVIYRKKISKIADESFRYMDLLETSHLSVTRFYGNKICITRLFFSDGWIMNYFCRKFICLLSNKTERKRIVCSNNRMYFIIFMGDRVTFY